MPGCTIRALALVLVFLPAGLRAQVEIEDGESSALSLNFGVYQTDKATVMYRQFIPILEHLQGRLEVSLKQPVDIQLRIYKTYEDGIEALVKGQADFVRFGPASYIQAKDRASGVRLLAMEHKDGERRFQGYIIVRRDSPIQSLAQLRGKRFAFGDPNSTIGRYLSQAALVQAGLSATDLDRYEYLGRHDKVGRSVELGDHDAGALKANTFKKMNREGRLRVLHSFDNVTKPWVSRAGLPDPIHDALRSSLLAIEDPAVLDALGFSGFLPATDQEYQFVREGMTLAGKFGK